MAMTRSTEENIARVRDESEYVDKVGKRIKTVQTKIDELEHSLPGIVSGFENQNAVRLTEVEKRLFAQVEERVGSLQTRVDGAGTRVQEFSEEVARLQSETDEQSVAARRGLEELHQQLALSARDELADMVGSAREDLEENREQVEAFRHETELRFESIRSDAASQIDELRVDLDALVQTAAERLEGLAREGRSLETDSLQALTGYIEERTGEVRASLEAQLASMATEAETLTGDALERVGADIDRRIEEHREQLNSDILSMRERFGAMRSELDEWMEKNRQAAEELEEQVETLQSENRIREEERSRIIEQRSAEAAELLDNHRSDLDARMKRLEETVEHSLGELQGRIEADAAAAGGRIDRHQEKMKQALASLEQRFESDVAAMQSLGSEADRQMEELTQRLSAEASELGDRLDRVTGDLAPISTGRPVRRSSAFSAISKQDWRTTRRHSATGSPRLRR
jgi:predicted  nucleic acid-binding Zn-ribbon protein